MPADPRLDYEEARSIVERSPRGAAALLRLVVQKLCKELGGRGRNLNEDIKVLVAKGLDVKVQKALDVLRVVGNHAVHPLEMDLRDDHDTAAALFVFTNLIVEQCIAQERKVDAAFDLLPKGAVEQIKRRDGPAKLPARRRTVRS